MVRSDVHRTAPHTNWVEVTSRRFPPPLVVVSRTQLGEKTDDVAHDISYATHYGLNSDIARGPKRADCVAKVVGIRRIAKSGQF